MGLYLIDLSHFVVSEAYNGRGDQKNNWWLWNTARQKEQSALREASYFVIPIVLYM